MDSFFMLFAVCVRACVHNFASTQQVPELPPSSVASLVWAYAKMGHPSAELMERVVRGFDRIVHPVNNLASIFRMFLRRCPLLVFVGVDVAGALIESC